MHPGSLSWSLGLPPLSREAWLEQRAHHHVCDPQGTLTQYQCPGGSSLAIITGLDRYQTPGKMRRVVEGTDKKVDIPEAFARYGNHHEPYARQLYSAYIERTRRGLTVLAGDKTLRFDCHEFSDLEQPPQYVVTIDGCVTDGHGIDHVYEIKCPAMRDAATIDSWEAYPFGIHPSYVPQLELYMRAYGVCEGRFVFFFGRDPQIAELCALPIHEFMAALRDDSTYNMAISRMRILRYVRCDTLWRYICERVSHFYSCLIKGESLGKVPSHKKALALVTDLLRVHEIEVVGRETEAAPHGQTRPVVEQEPGMNTRS